jgi:hypothetical protein
MRRSHIASILAFAAVPACTVDHGSADPTVMPSSALATGSLVAAASAISDGTVTTISIELANRSDGMSVNLDGGDEFVARVGGADVAMAEELYEDIPLQRTRARYEAVLASANPGEITIELARGDGSSAAVRVPVPAPYELANLPPAAIKMYDHVTFTIAPPPGNAESGTATFAITSLAPSQLYIDAFGQATFVAGDAGGTLGAPVDCALALAVVAPGSYDAAFGNTADDHPRGAQVRTQSIQLFP